MFWIQGKVGGNAIYRDTKGQGRLMVKHAFGKCFHIIRHCEMAVFDLCLVTLEADFWLIQFWPQHNIAMEHPMNARLQ